MQNSSRFQVPALKTKVGFRGVVSRQEVGGPICVGIIIGIVVS